MERGFNAEAKDAGQKDFLNRETRETREKIHLTGGNGGNRARVGSQTSTINSPTINPSNQRARAMR